MTQGSSLGERLAGWIGHAVLALAGLIATGIGVSVLMVAIYRFVPPQATVLMAWRGLQGETIRYYYTPLDRISPALTRSVIGAEDSRFCQHNGFDVAAIQKAISEAEQGKRLRGASTISQQTAKNAFLWPGRGWVRKGAEAWFTVLIETAWPKRRIMEVYLNIAEWGDGNFGAEAASRARFGKTAADLTPHEAALLAAVLPNPNKWRLDPPGAYVSGRAATLQSRAGSVGSQNLDGCAL